jgi:hypothetical protein
MCHLEVSYNKPNGSYSAPLINWWGVGKSVDLHCENNQQPVITNILRVELTAWNGP